MNDIDRARLAHLAIVRADFLDARDALSRALISLHSAASASEDPAWHLAKQTEELRDQANAGYIAVHEMFWRAAGAPHVPAR